MIYWILIFFALGVIIYCEYKAVKVHVEGAADTKFFDELHQRQKSHILW